MKLIKASDLMARFDYKSMNPFYNYMKNEGFPLPIKVGRRNFWKQEEVEAWINSREQRLDSPIRSTNAASKPRVTT